jgi:hypothetical protein
MGFQHNPEFINLNGRPKKGQTITDIIQKMGEEKKVNIDGNDVTWREALSTRVWNLALKGDLQALKYVVDRIDGKPKETIDINDSKEDKLERLIEVVSNKAKNE